MQAAFRISALSETTCPTHCHCSVFDGCVDLEAADIHCYEEVRRMAPFQRRLLVLAGPHGVGRRSLKERLIRDSPRRFAGVVPCVW